jgi:NADPH2 dehydrogenase
MSVLFSSFSLKDLRLKNRIVMPPMCMYSSDDGGKAKEWHFCHYQTRAVGGVGLVMVEATAVDPAGRISGQDLGIWDDDHIPGLRKIADLCRSRGAAVGIQLAHAGRKSTVLHTPIRSSGSARFSPDYRAPEPMTLEEIARTVKAFGAAASRALEAGFDLIEIHAAHGYLLNQFLSPLVNTRTDEYGGSPENRARIVAEVVEEVRRVWPNDKPLQIRVSAEEFAAGGNDPRRTAELVNLVKAGGVDIVHGKFGGVTPDPVKAYPGYHDPLCRDR